ncbi:prepilin peptidase [Actinomadura roseirufa]|uniref:prepilin peptidase n=1 Tax=Actinomadura roseirufa TaxID=2094049 RepID=UPI0010418478|nr:prepilin peptidase [Actinomadura roseirufa]
MDAPDPEPAPEPAPGPAWSVRADWTVPLRRRPAAAGLLCAAVLAALTARIGLRADLPAFLWIGVAGSLLGMVDVALKRLPEPLTLPSYAAGLALFAAAACCTAGGAARFAHALIGMAALGALFGVPWALLPAGTIGFGDVTLAGLLGLYLGWLGPEAWFLGVTGTFVFAAAVSLTLLATGRADRGTQIPYGPFLLAGALAAVLVHGP